MKIRFECIYFTIILILNTDIHIVVLTDTVFRITVFRFHPQLFPKLCVLLSKKSSVVVGSACWRARVDGVVPSLFF